MCGYVNGSCALMCTWTVFVLLPSDVQFKQGPDAEQPKNRCCGVAAD